MIEAIFIHPWVWILPILMVLCLILIAFDIFFDWMGFGATCGTVFFLLLSGAYFGLLLPPYDTSYYQTYRITGEIIELEAAFDSDGGTLSNSFVAKIDGVDEYIHSTDQRFRAVEVGDDIRLACDKKFQYFQEPYYSCAFGS